MHRSSPNAQRPTPNARWRWLRETLESVILGVALALVIRAFVVQAYKIPSGSMRPTLIEGDRIFVNKFIYRFRQPARGEVIVFRYPEQPKREFIKRVAAVAGDSVAIREGQLVVDGEVITEKPFAQLRYTNQGNLASAAATLTVPEDSYFVLGDNSGSSRDSRYWGFVPKKYVIGKSLIIFWPVHRWRIVK